MMGEIRLKVCGMRDQDNIRGLGVLQPDFMGFIFYDGSKRYVGEYFDRANMIRLNSSIKKVGVFVDQDKTQVINKAIDYQLDYVQLHGNESIEDCQFYRQQGVGVIKVFSVSGILPSKAIEEYTPYVDFFLFDTQTPKYGGSGKKFDWSILTNYNGSVPFFISGGIGPNDVDQIKKLILPELYGIDVNSALEIEPGLKDLDKVSGMLHSLRVSKNG